MHNYKSSSERGGYFTTEHFAIASGNIDSIFHISNSADKFFPTVYILDLIKE